MECELQFVCNPHTLRIILTLTTNILGITLETLWDPFGITLVGAYLIFWWTNKKVDSGLH